MTDQQALYISGETIIIGSEQTNGDELRIRLIDVDGETICRNWKSMPRLIKYGTVQIARKGDPEFDQYEFGGKSLNIKGQHLSFNQSSGRILILKPETSETDALRARIMSTDGYYCQDWSCAVMSRKYGTLLICDPDHPDYERCEFSAYYLE